MVLGLDMRFLGGNRRKINRGESNGNRISRFALRATLQRYHLNKQKTLLGDPVLRQSGSRSGLAWKLG